MEITDVKIFSANKKGGKLAYANVVLNNEFIIKRITLVENKGKRFIGMPSIRSVNGQKVSFRDICHPLNNEFREKITEAVFEAYDEFEKELEAED